MNRDHMMFRINGIQHTPVSDAELVEALETPFERFRSDGLEIDAQSFKLVHNLPGESRIERRELVRGLRSEVNLIGQGRASLSFTLAREIRSVETREA